MSYMFFFIERFALPILTVHIIGGFIALSTAFLVAVYTLAVRPNTKSLAITGARHRAFWSIFIGAMFGNGITAMLLAIINIPPDYFLLAVGWFTLYMTVTALRSLWHARSSRIDNFYAVLMLIVGAGMVVYGGVVAIGGHEDLRSAIVPLILFGTIGIGFAWRDVRLARGAEIQRRFLARAFGVLIAALTAFLVVNVDLEALAGRIMVWTTPTLLLTLLIRALYRLQRLDSAMAERLSPLAARVRGHLLSIAGPRS